MLIGYFDESGTHGQATVTTVAGFVATEERWAAFDDGWRYVLREFGLSAFHTKECAHFAGEYEQFRNQEADRRFLLAALAAVIQKTCLFGCATSVIKKDHAMVNAEGRLGSAYSLATKGCMSLAQAWMEMTARQPPLDIVLEAGCAFSKDFRRELDQEERPLGALKAFGRIDFCTREECVALQAADYLAYEQCKYFTDCVKQNRAVEPRMTMRMLKSVPHEYKLMDAYTLGDLLVTVVLNDLRQAGEL